MEDDGPPGVPEWVVTYGDMMSLLLTFFIMLVSLSEVVADQKFRAMLESLQQRFGYQTSAPAAPGENFPLNGMLEKLTSLGAYTDDETGTGGIKTKGVTGIDFRVFRNREGDGLPVGEPLLFQPESADISPEVAEQLDDVGRRLAGMPNKIEVHGLAGAESPVTKDAPVQASLRDLCFERARLVRRELLDRGVDPDRVRIVVDTRRLPQDPAREFVLGDRVQVFVLDTRTEDFVGRREG